MYLCVGDFLEIRHGDASDPFGEVMMVVDRQIVKEQAREAGDQCRRSLEVPCLSLDQGAASVVEFFPGRRAIAPQGENLVPDVVDRFRESVGLERGGD